MAFVLIIVKILILVHKLQKFIILKIRNLRQISNTNLKYKININIIRLSDGKVFISSGGNFEVFNLVDKKFSIIAPKGQYISNLHEYIYTINNYSDSNIIQLKSKRNF